MASAAGTTVAAISRLVAADADTVRDVIHAFTERGLAALDPRWAGGRPRLISDADIGFIVTTGGVPRTVSRPLTSAVQPADAAAGARGPTRFH